MGEFLGFWFWFCGEVRARGIDFKLKTQFFCHSFEKNRLVTQLFTPPMVFCFEKLFEYVNQPA